MQEMVHMKSALRGTVLILFAASLSAQVGRPGYTSLPELGGEPPDSGRQHMVVQSDMKFRMMGEAADRAAMEAAERREAAFEEQEFIHKFNDFTVALHDFVDYYNRYRAVDVKKAKAVREAWHKVAKAEMWLRDGK
jgi:hypothetical protein